MTFHELFSIVFAIGVASGSVFHWAGATETVAIALGACVAGICELFRGKGLILFALVAGFATGSAGVWLCALGFDEPHLHGFPSRCNSALKSVIDSIPFPDSRSGPLIKALLTADRSGLTSELKNVFRGSGASHLLALSGMHIGIVYSIMTKILKPFGNSPSVRLARGICIIILCGFFTVMTGAGASLSRAFIFIALRESAGLLHREMPPLKTLFNALTVQLAISPWNISRPGFQLSYMAMTGIYLIFPFLSRLYRGRGPLKKLWDAAALSISCQVLTAPVAWIHFGTFPKYFIITNLIAMPLTGVIMALSIAVVAASALGICPGVLVRVCSGACSLLLLSLETVSSLP